MKFETYQAAEKYIKKRTQLGEYNIYCCPYCGKYHIGHQDNKRE
jgi:heme/copper-type cytochrome/quinol oxidase subunit 2